MQTLSGALYFVQIQTIGQTCESYLLCNPFSCFYSSNSRLFKYHVLITPAKEECLSAICSKFKFGNYLDY